VPGLQTRASLTTIILIESSSTRSRLEHDVPLNSACVRSRNNKEEPWFARHQTDDVDDQLASFQSRVCSFDEARS
jgi:hypothetical protein